MTGYNSRELELEVRKQGVLYYMIKPFEIGDLRSLLDHISKKRSTNVTVQPLRHKEGI
jgi:response regulator of citrate/malate metabolism